MISQRLQLVSEELQESFGLVSVPVEKNVTSCAKEVLDLRPVEMFGYFTICFIDA